MDVTLKVLEGSRAGAKVAIKRDEFFIGRSPKCQLCAGSSTISRRHCVIRRQGTTVTIEDLQSRNGTRINGEKISQPTELATGDELTIGALRFLVTISHGISDLKKPQVKSVAEAVDRAAASGEPSFDDEDISKWLLDADSNPTAVSETQTIQLDDTNAVQVQRQMETQAEAEQAQPEHPAPQPEQESDDSPNDSALQETEKKNSKPKPGKLPPRSDKPTAKDSREAALEALRNWNRRR